MTIKKHHVLATFLLLVGLLYVFHMYSVHGTFKQALSGVGINR